MAAARNEQHREMTGPDYDRLAEIVAAAEELSGSVREHYLKEACPPEWREEVESLLSASDGGRDAFEQKATALGEILTAFRSEQLTGQSIGSYQLEAILGAGGMSVVYRGRHRETGECVAVKVINARHGDANWASRFEREVRTLQTIRHENVVRLIESGEDESFRYIAMELVAGESLRARNPNNWRGAVAIGQQLATALKTVHAAGVIHRDLKPENVMLTGNERAVLIDFGLARKQEKPSGSGGGISGTFGYFSPEQVRGEAASDRADIFALGAILYEMATGKRAFEGSSPLATAAAILSGKIPVLPGWLPSDLATLIRRCLKQDAVKRPTAAEVEERLARLAKSSNPPTLARQRWIRGGFAAVATVAFTIAAWTSWVIYSPAPLFLQAMDTHGMQVFEPALAWNGGWLAFTSPGEGAVRNVWISPAGAWKPRQVTFDRDGVAEPSLSPDGSRLAFRSLRNPAGIYLRDLASGSERLLASGGRAPRFSPDGRWIAYWTGNEMTADHLRQTPAKAFIIAADGGGTPENIAPELRSARDPVWAPDSRRLAFQGNSTLHLWDRRTQRDLPFSTGPRQPVAWRSKFGNEEILTLAGDRVMMLALEALQETALTQPGESIKGFAQDSSGRNVLSTEEASEGLWNLQFRAPGARPTPLLRGGGNFSMPSISPDGNRLLYWTGKDRELRELISGEVTKASLRATFTAAGKIMDIPLSPGVSWDISARGDAVLARCRTEDNRRRCICLRQNGSERVLLQHPRLHLYSAVFSPDQSRIVFTGESDDSPPQIFLASAGGASPDQWQVLGPGEYPRFAPDGSIAFLHKSPAGYPALYRMTVGRAPALLYEFTEHSPSPGLVRPGFFRIAAARDRLVFPLGEQAGRFHHAEQISSVRVSPFSSRSPVSVGGGSFLTTIKKYSHSAILSAFTILGLAAPSAAAPITLQNATATFSQTAFGGNPVGQAIDGNFAPENGWAVLSGSTTSAQTAVFESASDVGFAGGTSFEFTFSQFLTSTPGTLLGRFRLSITTDERSLFADGLSTGGDVTANWVVLMPTGASATNGATLTILGDGSILSGGTRPANSVYTVNASTALTGITGFRLEMLEDPSLPTNGPGRANNGNFALTEFQVDASQAAIPEPSSALLLIAPLAGGWLLRRWRQRA
jgi:Tol biopolymer transport system component/predicted Ser/Thr protein kinase